MSMYELYKGFHCNIPIHTYNVLLSNSPIYYSLLPLSFLNNFNRLHHCFCFLFVLFGGTWGWTPSPPLARQVVYYLSHSTSLFKVGYFEIGSCFMLELAQTAIFLFVLPWVAGTIGKCHHAQPLVEMKSWEHYCPCCPRTTQSMPPK
jgi:hypothetical protein